MWVSLFRLSTMPSYENIKVTRILSVEPGSSIQSAPQIGSFELLPAVLSMYQNIMTWFSGIQRAYKPTNQPTLQSLHQPYGYSLLSPRSRYSSTTSKHRHFNPGMAEGLKCFPGCCGGAGPACVCGKPAIQKSKSYTVNRPSRKSNDIDCWYWDSELREANMLSEEQERKTREEFGSIYNQLYLYIYISHWLTFFLLSNFVVRCSDFSVPFIISFDIKTPNY